MFATVQTNSISERAVSRASPRRHPRQHRDMRINIVIDNDLTFPVVEPVQTASILSKRSPPRDWHREKQRVESRVIEPLPEVSPSCNQQSLFVISNGREALDQKSALPVALSTLKDDNIFGEFLKTFSE